MPYVIEHFLPLSFSLRQGIRSPFLYWSVLGLFSTWKMCGCLGYVHSIEELFINYQITILMYSQLFLLLKTHTYRSINSHCVEVIGIPKLARQLSRQIPRCILFVTDHAAFW